MKKQEIEIRKCICGKECVVYNIGKGKMVACHQASANGCGKTGPVCKTSEEAITRWNEMMKHRLNPMKGDNFAGGYVTLRPEIIKELQSAGASNAGRIKIGHVPDVTIVPFGKNIKGVGKTKMNLLLVDMYDAVNEVCEVMTHGAEKHEPCGWRRVPNGVYEYTDALHRHLNAEARGEVKDKEFDKHHAAHAACCAMIRLQLIIEAEKKGKGI